MSDRLQAIAPAGYGMPGLSERITKILRSLMRHRERYIRAWMAHYGARPDQVVLVESWIDDARYFTEQPKSRTFEVRFRKDTDDVAELVRAARELSKGAERDVSSIVAYTTNRHLAALDAALKKFEGVK